MQTSFVVPPLPHVVFERMRSFHMRSHYVLQFYSSRNCGCLYRRFFDGFEALGMDMMLGGSSSEDHVTGSG